MREREKLVEKVFDLKCCPAHMWHVVVYGHALGIKHFCHRKDGLCCGSCPDRCSNPCLGNEKAEIAPCMYRIPYFLAQRIIKRVNRNMRYTAFEKYCLRRRRKIYGK